MNEVFNIGLEFLQKMDEYLRQNLLNLKCVDIYNIYIGFWNNLKDFRGTSDGFTGLGEFLIFRVLYHLLEKESGEFSPQPIGQLIKFVNNNFQIGQNLPINIESKRQRPDIVIYRNNPAESDNPTLIGVIEIKVYPVEGYRTINNVLKGLTNIRKYNPEAKGMLIIFSKVSQGILNNLQNITANKPWFNFLVLFNNNNILKKELNNWLNL